jgi:1-acyl-sn-glycerol-3-phosphate acyltransferase
MKRDMENIAKRPTWFKGLKQVLKLFIPRAKFVYLGEKISTPAIILSNHVGASAPLAWELYFSQRFRFWGAHEMTCGLKSVYKYLSEVYFPQKKHWNKTLAKLFCLIAAPLANLFYKGLQLIPTYRDARFRQTIEKSLNSVKSGNNLIIFPEDSRDGYHDNLKSFYAGFTVIGDACLKEGIDLPVYVSYYRKKEKTFLIDKPILFSKLRQLYADRQKLADLMCERINRLLRLFHKDKASSDARAF